MAIKNNIVAINELAIPCNPGPAVRAAWDALDAYGSELAGPTSSDEYQSMEDAIIDAEVAARKRLAAPQGSGVWMVTIFDQPNFKLDVALFTDIGAVRYHLAQRLSDITHARRDWDDTLVERIIHGFEFNHNGCHWSVDHRWVQGHPDTVTEEHDKQVGCF